jgi:hypothetical protein
MPAKAQGEYKSVCWAQCWPDEDGVRQVVDFPAFSGGGGGAGGIRTLDTLLTYTHFPGERLRPLGHRSALLWKGVC